MILFSGKFGALTLKELRTTLFNQLTPLAVVLVFLGLQWRYQFLSDHASYLLGIIILSEYITLQTQAVFVKAGESIKYFGFLDYRFHAIFLLGLFALHFLSLSIYPIVVIGYGTFCIVDFSYRIIHAFKEVINHHGIRKAQAA